MTNGDLGIIIVTIIYYFFLVLRKLGYTLISLVCSLGTLGLAHPNILNNSGENSFERSDFMVL